MGQLTPADQRNIPYHMTSHSAYKVGRKVIQGVAAHDLAEYQSAGGEQLSSFALLIFLGLNFPLFVVYIIIVINNNIDITIIIKFSLSQFPSFLDFTLPIIFHLSCWGRGSEGPAV